MKENILSRFMKGVTFFHIAGLALMLFGGQYGTATKVGGDVAGINLAFTITFAQFIGAVTFFWELIKAKITRRKE